MPIPATDESTSTLTKGAKPNVVIIYADDMGCGDVGFMNPDSKIPTPNIDALAGKGMSFSDAHSTSSICSPSRYGLLTGRYPWRTSKVGNPAVGAPHWIRPERMTLATLFCDQGYDTACIGKWGLGAGWSSAVNEDWGCSCTDMENIDFTAHLPIGETNGFTYDDVFLFFGTNPSGRVWPTKFSEAMGDGRDGWRESTCWWYENGWAEDPDNVDFFRFHFGDAQIRTVERSVEYIDSKGGKQSERPFNQNEDAPFFLYCALHVPHGPYFVDKRFEGKSQAGLYGDYCVQLDWSVEQIVEALERNGLSENTILVFTADNGPDPNQYRREDVQNHCSRGEWSGGKFRILEGGHRVPMVVCGRGIEAGAWSDYTVSQVDYMATFADLLGVELPPRAGEDSFSFLPLLRGEAPEREERPPLVHEGFSYQGFRDGHRLGLRYRDWVYLEPSTEDIAVKPNEHEGPQGGFEYRQEWLSKEIGNGPEAQLYHLGSDPRQLNNLAETYPEVARFLLDLLGRQRSAVRTICPEHEPEALRRAESALSGKIG